MYPVMYLLLISGHECISWLQVYLQRLKCYWWPCWILIFPAMTSLVHQMARINKQKIITWNKHLIISAAIAMRTEHRIGQLLALLLSFQALIVVEWGGLSTWHLIIRTGGARWHGQWGRRQNICDPPCPAQLTHCMASRCPTVETIKIEERRFPGILFGIWLQNLDVGDIKQDILPLLIQTHQWWNT